MTADPAALIGVGLSVDGLAETLAEVGPALDALESLDIDSAEIFLPALGVVLGGSVHRPRLNELRRLCADRPFDVTLHGPLSADLGDRDTADLQRDVCRAGLEVAGEIGARVYVQHQTIASEGTDAVVAERLLAEREALLELAPYAEAASTVLGVETMYCHAGEWTALPHELAAQVSAVDHPAVGAVFDFSHAALNAAARGVDFLESSAALAPFTRHLHLHDSFGRPPEFRPWSRGDAFAFGFGDVHLPPGDGALPWSDLAQLAYGGPAIANLELDRRWRADWPRSIAFARDWIADAQAAVNSRVQLAAGLR